MAKHFKQTEVANILGVQAITISRYTMDILAGYGFEKHGKGRGCYYTKVGGMNIQSNPQLPNGNETKGDLEIKRMKVDIEQKQSKLESYQMELFDLWSDSYLEVFLDSFSPLKDIMVKLKLDDGKANEWNKEIESCISVFRKDSKSICEKVLKELRAKR